MQNNNKTLGELSTRAFELRLDFIKNYNPKKEHLRDILAFATNAICISDYPDNDVFEALFDDMGDIEVTFDVLQEKTKAKPEYILAATAYSSFEHKHMNYFEGPCNYRENAELDLVYEFLQAVGYQMSDEERALKDGTHELYVRE